MVGLRPPLPHPAHLRSLEDVCWLRTQQFPVGHGGSGYPFCRPEEASMSDRTRTRRRQAADAPQPRRGKWLSADTARHLGCAHPIRRAVCSTSAFSPDREWVWTAARGWLEVLPGVATAVGGFLLLSSRNRFTAMLGAWLTVFAGAWFVVGRALAGPLGLGDVGDSDRGDRVRAGRPRTGVLLRARCPDHLPRCGLRWAGCPSVAPATSVTRSARR